MIWVKEYGNERVVRDRNALQTRQRSGSARGESQIVFAHHNFILSFGIANTSTGAVFSHKEAEEARGY